jgi:uncharacterized protein
MMLIDANLLIYAYNPSAPQHAAARRWLERAVGGPAPVRLAWTSVLAFVRIMTNPQLFRRPLTSDEAIGLVDEWLGHPAIGLLEPTERHWTILRGLIGEGQATGPLVMDAHLAALALEHGATLCTTDRDFSRFAGLSVVNPLA